MTRRRVRWSAAVVVSMLLAMLAPVTASAQDSTGASVEAAAAGLGYVAVTEDGELVGFGQYVDVDDLAELGVTPNQPMVDVESTVDGRGFWLTAADGGVFALGDATFYGSTGDIRLNQPVVAMTATPTGAGYWFVASDGGVFSYGDAAFYGSTGDITLNQPIVDMVATPSGEGYWLVAADGGIFAFGDAGFQGSAANETKQGSVVGMAPTSTGNGYWIVTSAGQIFAYGDAADVVDLVEQGVELSAEVVAVYPSDDGGGAMMITSEAAVYGVGDAFRGASFRAADAHEGGQFVSAALVPNVFRLTLMHNNDGESNIDPNDAGEGGISQFAATVDALRAAAAGDVLPGGTALLSSGDNFLASVAFQASLDLPSSEPIYDAIALSEIGYDAIAIGNHEFDFGPDVLARFVEDFDGGTPFLSANLDFSAEASLQALVTSGDIAPTTVFQVDGRQVGVIGISPPYLADISSPGGVVIDQDVATVIQSRADALTADGVDIVIVISHLQDIDEDRALITGLSGVDVVIAGGGDELLANDDDVLGEGDVAALPYPVLETDADGNTVPVVTTAGNYKYVGQLVLDFDVNGNLIQVVEDGSGPVLVTDANGTDATIDELVVEPIDAYSAGLASTVVASSEVELESDRGNEFGTAPGGKRVQETNLGNLVADSQLWQAQQLAAGFGVDAPQIAIANGGGIRDDDYSDGATTPFDITLADTFNILPFGNQVGVIEDLTASQIEEVLEVAYGSLPGANGAFAQVAGMQVAVEFDGTTVDVTDIDVDLDGNGTYETSLLASNVPTMVTVDLAINNFSARGGDGYTLGDETYTALGVTYQQALRNFLEGPLGGTVAAADYPVVPVGGGARILITDNS